MKLMNARGNVDLAISWVYGLIVIGFLLGAGLLALGAFQDATYVSTSHSQNITLLNGTAVALTYDVETFGTLVNATNTSESVPAGNYTVGTKSITLIVNGTWNNSLATASYTYLADGDATAPVGSVITSLGNFATQLGTVGTMLGIALLIAVVFGALAYVAIKRSE